MNQKEIAELRKRMRPNKNSIDCIYGCYVNAGGKIIGEYEKKVSAMSEAELDKYLKLLRKCYSGLPGKNLLDIQFTTEQVQSSPEHQLLMDLNKDITNAETRKKFYEKVVAGFELGEHYLILLAHDNYDVPFMRKDGKLDPDESEDVFPSVICALCPVKKGKPDLEYINAQQDFLLNTDRCVTRPEIGFTFPAFDDRRTNIYNALYYCGNKKDNYPKFVEELFCSTIPKPAAEQKAMLDTALEEALEEECTYDVVRYIHEGMLKKIEEYKANKDENPMIVTGTEVKNMLQECGISQEKRDAFATILEEDFGKNMETNPKNLIRNDRLEIKHDGVVCKINADYSKEIQTRIIDGQKYLMIRVEGDVTVNDVVISVSG